MSGVEECVVEWIRGGDYAGVTAASGTALKNTVIRLSKEYPEVKIIKENADGSIFAHIPINFVKIRPPKKVLVTEEHRDKLRENMKKANQVKQDSIRKRIENQQVIQESTQEA